MFEELPELVEINEGRKLFEEPDLSISCIRGRRTTEREGEGLKPRFEEDGGKWKSGGQSGIGRRPSQIFRLLL